MADQPTITLNSGASMPQLGFGVFKVPDDQATAAVLAAFQAGYRSIDTAAMYRNEEGVGAAIAQSGIPRDELFITTKLNNDGHGHDAALRAFEASRTRLGLDYVDLYLIHWPLPAQDRYVETWQAFEKLQRDGLARSIGVSNFAPAHLQRLFDETDVVPALNQVELHPVPDPGRAARLRRRARDRDRGLVADRPGRRAPDGSGRHLARREVRQDAGADRDPLAPSARQRRHPEVGHAVAHRREHRRLRLRTGRRRRHLDQRAEPRRAHRPGPGAIQPLTLAWSRILLGSGSCLIKRGFWSTRDHNPLLIKQDRRRGRRPPAAHRPVRRGPARSRRRSGRARR